MIATRIIPCLLLRNQGLVKTVKFKEPKYLGDPINIVRIFNDKEVDELVFLDITATPEKKKPPMELLSRITSECFMPLCYGGGVRDLDTMSALYGMGVEKVALNTIAVENPALVSTASTEFGSQSVIVSIDVKKKLFGGYEVVTNGGRKATGLDPIEHARSMERAGAGEILLNSVDRDGTMQGYDLDLVRRVSSAVGIPVVACGGAANVADLSRVVKDAGASAAAAGSMFVFQGQHRAVLISYPSQKELRAAFA
jgi:imidazole glycerol-phosphate synthase subunit HisF